MSVVSGIEIARGGAGTRGILAWAPVALPDIRQQGEPTVVRESKTLFLNFLSHTSLPDARGIPKAFRLRLA